MRRSWLTNRFVITFGGAALLALAWNLYVSANNDGVIEGVIVAPDGNPVPGATVTLIERTLLVSQPRGSTTTDAEGRFAFRDHNLHRLYLEAAKEGVGRLPQREYRLYFKGQNLSLQEPLQLAPRGASG